MGLRVPGSAPELKARGVLLRSPVHADVEGRRRCGDDPEIIRMFGGAPGFAEHRSMTVEAAEAWFERLQAEGNPLEWVIEVDDGFIGTARLHSIVEADRRARYAIGILDRSALGRGFGTTVTRLVLEYGFDVVGFHRIDLRVLAFNTRAIACYRKCGFVEEGREREAALIDGTWHDDVIMSALQSEYTQSKTMPSGD
jgi:RimJ/RimL family protein N-acetyltransferase